MFINMKQLPEIKARPMNDILTDIKSKLNDKALDYFDFAKSSWIDDVEKQLSEDWMLFEIKSQYTKSGRPELVYIQE